MEISTTLRIKLTELKTELNQVIDSISLQNSCKDLSSLNTYLEQMIDDFKAQSRMDRCDVCRVLTDKELLVLTTNYEDLCPLCRKADASADCAYPSQAFFGVR